MSRASRALSRLVVVGAGTAVMATGVVPLAMGVANAAPTSIAISPTSDTETVGNCNPYTVTTQPTQSFDVQISQTTKANPSLTTIGFCDPTGYDQLAAGSNPQAPGATHGGDCNTGVTGGAAGQTKTATCDGDFTSDANGKATFGVLSDTPGTMNIVAYNDVNSNNVFESGIDSPSASATKTWVANQAATLTCDPQTATNQAGAGNTHSWTCSAKTSANTGVDSGSLTVNWVVTNGPDQGQSGTCTEDTAGTGTGSNTGNFGNYDCGPVTNNGTAGTDDILVYADNDASGTFTNGDVSTTIHKTWAAAAPAGATLTMTCSPNQNNADGSECLLPTSHHAATVTGKVLNGSTPVSGVIISFSTSSDTQARNGTPSTTLDPTSCVTAADGTCSTTVTAQNPGDFEGVIVNGSVELAVGGPATDTVRVLWKDPRPYEARFVTVAPDSANQPSGGAQTFVISVTDRFGNPIDGICVGVTNSGPGHFESADPSGCGSLPTGTPTGTVSDIYDTTCYTNTNGQCRVILLTASAETGTSTVTADIATDDANTFNGEPFFVYDDNNGVERAADECSLGADTTYGSTTVKFTDKRFLPNSTDQNPPTGAGATQTQSGLAAGACTDTGHVTWGSTPPPPTTKKQHPYLNCWSPKRHVLKCKVVSHPRVTGATVKFRKVHKDGTFGKVIAVRTTDGAGVAKFKKRHLRSGKIWRVVAHVGRVGNVLGGFSNVDKTRIK